MGTIFTPRGPQLKGIQWLVKHSYAGLFWDPGRGKTITILQAYKILRDAGLVRNMLVVGSTNIVDGVWPREIEKFDDLDLTYSLIRGSEGKRLDAWDLDADVYLTNPENLHWLFSTFGKDLGLDMLTIDESSKFRNGKVRRRRKKSGQKVKSAFGALMKFIPFFKRRYILTGTPIPKGYLNLWPQAYIMDRGESLGYTLTAYRNNYFNPCGWKGKEWVIREGADKQIIKALSGRIHRAERDNKVPIEFFDLEVELSPDEREVYGDLEKEFIAEWKGKTLLAANAAVATQKLRQAANGAIYYDRKHNWTMLHARKAEALIELVAELQGQPLLIATEFDHDLEMIAKAGLKIPLYKGSKEHKDKLQKEWDAGNLPTMGGHIGSLSHGLNFQYGGCNVLYYGLTFNLDDYEQFYQRVWRDGQTKSVIAYNLVTVDTVDNVMLDVLDGRSRTQQELLKALKRRYEL